MGSKRISSLKRPRFEQLVAERGCWSGPNFAGAPLPKKKKKKKNKKKKNKKKKKKKKKKKFFFFPPPYGTSAQAGGECTGGRQPVLPGNRAGRAVRCGAVSPRIQLLITTAVFCPNWSGRIRAPAAPGQRRGHRSAGSPGPPWSFSRSGIRCRDGESANLGQALDDTRSPAPPGHRLEWGPRHKKISGPKVAADRKVRMGQGCPAEMLPRKNRIPRP